MKDSAMDDNEFSNETSEEDSVECDENEISKEAKGSIHDHPFSIDSILNGRTRRRKSKQRKNSVTLEQRKYLEENALPLNALEEFTNKAFSSMKPERTSHDDEGTVLSYLFLF